MQTEAKLNAQVTAGEARNKAAWFTSQAKDNRGQELQTSQDMCKRIAAMQAAVITKEAEKKSRVRSGPVTRGGSLSQEVLHSPQCPQFLGNPASFLPCNASNNTLPNVDKQHHLPSYCPNAFCDQRVVSTW